MEKAVENNNLWKTAIAGITVILSFPFVYLGGVSSNYILIVIGMIMLIGGVIATPVITFLDSRYNGQK